MRSRGVFRAGIAYWAYFLLPWDTLGQSLLYDLIGASSAVAVAAGRASIVRHSPLRGNLSPPP